MVPESEPGKSTATEDHVFYPPPELRTDAHVPDLETYKTMYKKSVEKPEEFWSELAKEFYWKSSPTGKFLDYNFDVTKGKIYVKFMEGAITNICYNIIDRNITEKNLGDKIAYFWEGNDPNDCLRISYKDLLKHVCKCANVLKKLGVKKGDRVAVYLPMIPELLYTMLACARIGAVHSIVFAGFSAESLCDRILDSQCAYLITADGFFRGEKMVNLKQIADEALEKCRDKENFAVKACIVVKHLGTRLKKMNNCNQLQISWNSDTDLWWHDLMANAAEVCEPEWLSVEDPLFILYTSGSTGKPKFEGIPVYPQVDRFWEIIEKYKVTTFYTAPTAIRMLMKYGEEPVKKHNLKSLKILGSVGEPINPEAWMWYYRFIGNSRCPIVDTFWQTETGGHVMTPLPAAFPLKPGSATLPFFGVVPALLNEHGEELLGEAEGYLVFSQPWPSLMRTIYGNHERFESTYFRKFPGFYVTGDGCRRDKDGYYWITGRIDDMLNVSGHLLSTAEVESALTEHLAVAEAAVVSRPHPVKGECLYCFVTLRDGHDLTDALTTELRAHVREKIGPIASPDFIQSAPGLPKTRSGKIMRRVLRQIARNERDLGDISTLADPSIVEVLFSQRCQAAA
ncbi:acetyl-coenzyme A synthetase, cytoplasmic-like isoform X2 [Protopterus annectens]|uniref:acetyl-coenzyme A synthetase, cytoplasmic-like isoform X2 n=1 Tax=Protopterus annectens TaxID=7888 RepID=UPI001CFACC53|nr:acetyl-coenzyme A synthetase, cytoplasmic-like isoform X2 [Protopterus annectens]